MSEFDDMIAEGFAGTLDFLGVEITYAGKTAKCVPATQPQQQEQRDTGMWESGMQVIELFASEMTRLGLVADSVLKLAGKPMKVKTIDSDEGDPCVRLTLRPHQVPAE